jgi:hypothetical protein
MVCSLPVRTDIEPLAFTLAVDSQTYRHIDELECDHRHDRRPNERRPDAPALCNQLFTDVVVADLVRDVVVDPGSA